MIGGGFLGGGISIVPAGKAIIYASMTTEDGANIPNAVFKATRTGSTVTANGGVDGRAELLVDAGHTYTVTVTPAGGSYLNNSQTVVAASAKSYAVKFYLYPAKANEVSTTASLNALNTSISTHADNKNNPHSVTKAQVGLGAYPTSPTDIGISTATQTALDGKADASALASHTDNVSNPHAVTKAQVGLGSVDNTSDTDKPISTATLNALLAVSDDLGTHGINLDRVITPLLPAVNCSELLTMYKGDTSLTESPLINAAGCTSLKDVFRGCSNLVTVNYIHTPNVKFMNYTFRECSSLTSVPEMDTSSVTDMTSMFDKCSSLTSVPALDTSSVTAMGRMFYMCTSLTSVTFTGDVVPPYGIKMFEGAPIYSGNGSMYVPDNLVDAYKNASGWSTLASVIKGISEKP